MAKLSSFVKQFFSKKTHQREELNVINSIAMAKNLYKELVVKAHPDKHLDKIELAQSLMEQVNNNRYNYSELLKLKEQIDKR